jgi:Membrane bound beta barrel domain (DUF5777)
METQTSDKKKKRTLSLNLLTFFLIIFLIPNKVECQQSADSGSTFKGGSYEKTFSTLRIGVVQSVMTAPQGEFHVVIQHRFGDISGGGYQFFGLDGALTRVGFDYGISNWLSAGIGRSIYEKEYDLELKAVILKQNEINIPLSLSYYLAVIDNTLNYYFPQGHSSFGSRLTFDNQLIVARNQGIFSLQVSPIWLHSDYEERTGGSLNIFAIAIDGRVRLSEKLGLIGEYIPILTKENFTNINPLTVGLDINTGGHQFQLVFGNSQGTNEQQIATNTVGSWTKGNIYFGFNLTRIFHSKMN